MAEWVAIEEPVISSLVNVPYLYLFTHDGLYVPWTPSPLDLFADDWQKLS